MKRDPDIGRIPEEIDPAPWVDRVQSASVQDVDRALAADGIGEREMAALLSPAAQTRLESMARKALGLTRQHFGRTIQLFAPLYLSSYCSSACTYCGFAADRRVRRHKLTDDEAARELDALRAMGIEEVLFLTGERTFKADFEFLRDHITAAARRLHQVAIEVFPMQTEEYRTLAESGCVSVSLYQETYHPQRYAQVHVFGDKRDYNYRLDGPARALEGGLRSVGLGALLGLSDPAFDMMALYRHARALERQYWWAGLSFSFPRIRPQEGGFQPPWPVSDRRMAQYIFAFRIAFPAVPLVLSTRESPAFRDSMAGLGISKMSVASKTTVGGYSDAVEYEEEQFAISDERPVEAFCDALRRNDLEPVFKNGEALYRARPQVLHREPRAPSGVAP